MTSAISLFVEKTSPRQDLLSSLPGMKLLHNPCDAACHRARPDPAFALSRCACDSGSRQEMEPLVLVDDDGLDVIDQIYATGLRYFLRFCCICLSYSRCSLPPDIRFSKKPSTHGRRSGRGARLAPMQHTTTDVCGGNWCSMQP